MKRCMGCMAEMSDSEKVCSLCGYQEGTDVKEAYYLLPGKVIGGKYMVGKVLGYGGFGVTYIGWDTQLNRKVAIKEYLPSDFATRSYGTVQLTVYSGEATVQFQSGLKSFIAEARRLAKFNSIPEIVDIYDCFMENDTGYIIMEFLEGKDVKTILKEKGQIPVDQAIDITMHVLHGLAGVHKEGIVHRDIAPDNIYITKSGDVKILDFGASRYATAVQSRSLSVILKPGYAPEEQYRSRGQQGPWTDVYAMGATFYRMLTGRRPKEAIERLANDDLPRPSELGVELPENVEIALMNALNVRQEFRTKDAETFYNELKSSQVERVEEEVIVEKQKVPVWGIAAAIIAGVAVLAGAGIFAASRAGFFKTTITDSKEVQLAEGESYVPDISSMSSDDAEDLLKEKELILQINGKNYSDTIAEGLILSQEPGSGEVVVKNDIVYVTMSGGVQEVTIPTGVVGASESDALAMLQVQGLAAGERTEEFSDVVAKGVVMEITSHNPGDTVAVNTAIDYKVSKGSEADAYKDLVVPDLTNMTVDEAMQVLQQLADQEGATFAIGATKEKNDKAEKGQIIKQSLKAGDVVNTRETITITVSKGPKKAAVPDMQYNMTEQEAISALSALGLEANVSYEYSSQVVSGKVISQSVNAGKEVEEGTQVSIVVSKGAKPKDNQNTNANASKSSEKKSSEKKSSETKSSQKKNTGSVSLGDDSDDLQLGGDDDISLD